MKSKAAILQDNRKLFYILIGVASVLMVSYMFMVHQTVRNVAERQRMETELSSLSSRIAELEFSYIALKNDITPEMAYNLGFEPVRGVTYVSRKSSVALADVRVQAD